MSDAAPSLLETLLRDPGRFSFDAAVDLALAASGGRPLAEALHFETEIGLRPAMRDVLAARHDPATGRTTLRIGFSGLTGPGGTLPRPYSETVNEEQRRGSRALAVFLDALSQRALQQYAEAGAKYLPHRTAIRDRAAAKTDRKGDPFAASLLALTGHGGPDDVERSGLDDGELLYFAGLFASRPRSSDRLASLIEEWLGIPVRIEQFVGTWQTLDPGERTRLGRAHASLGCDAACGARTWDIQSRVRIVLGPLSLAAFEELLPGGARLQRLDRLIRTYLDDEAGFAINPVLRADSVPEARLGDARLGQTAWLPSARPRTRDGDEAVFSEIRPVWGEPAVLRPGVPV